MDYPVWINADILPGPLNNTSTTPVDANRFLTGCKSLTSSVLSIGWTTRWGNNYTEGAYNDTQIDNMIDAITVNQNLLALLSLTIRLTQLKLSGEPNYRLQSFHNISSSCWNRRTKRRKFTSTGQCCE